MTSEETFGFDVDFDPGPTLGASEADPVPAPGLADRLREDSSPSGGLALTPADGAGRPPSAPFLPGVHFEFVRYSPRINHLGPDAALVLVRQDAYPGADRWLWMTSEQIDHNIRVFGAHQAFAQARAARDEWFAHSPGYRRRLR